MNEKYTYYLRYACISSALAAALALAAYASAANANQKQQQNLFMKMFGVSALGVSVLCVFSYFGMFHWLL